MAAKSNCPWSLPVKNEPATSLKDVMDEQLATNLQDKENDSLTQRLKENDLTDKELAKILSEDRMIAQMPQDKENSLTDEELAKILSGDTNDDDLMIAQMLQMQVRQKSRLLIVFNL